MLITTGPLFAQPQYCKSSVVTLTVRPCAMCSNEYSRYTHIYYTAWLTLCGGDLNSMSHCPGTASLRSSVGRALGF